MSREREIGAVVIVFTGCSISDQALTTVDQNNRVSLVCIAESTHSSPSKREFCCTSGLHRALSPDQPQSIKTTGLASAPHTRMFYLDQKQNQQGSVAQTYRTAPPGTAGELIHIRLYHLEVANSGQAASQKPPPATPTPESTQRPLLNKTIFFKIGRDSNLIQLIGANTKGQTKWGNRRICPK